MMKTYETKTLHEVAEIENWLRLRAGRLEQGMMMVQKSEVP